MPMFHVVLSQSGPEWRPSQPLEGQSGWREHAAFMDELVERGFIVLGGPVPDFRVVACVQAESEEEVRSTLARDPWSGVAPRDRVDRAMDDSARRPLAARRREPAARGRSGARRHEHDRRHAGIGQVDRRLDRRVAVCEAGTGAVARFTPTSGDAVVRQLTTPRNIVTGFCPLDTSTRPSTLIFSRPSERRSPRPRSICHGRRPR